MISKLLAALISFLAGMGKAIPTIAENKSKRLEIKEEAKRERARGRKLRIQRRNLRRAYRLRRRSERLGNNRD